MDIVQYLGMGFVLAVLGMAALGVAGYPVSLSAPPATGRVIEPLPAPPQGEVQRFSLGYRNYEYYFLATGSDTVTVKKGQPVQFEAVLSGPDQLVGCMKSIRTPWGSKVFRPGDTTFSFTPQETGLKGFSCGMGMGRGSINVVS